MCTEVFGIQIRYEVWNKQESLPLYIAGNYDFQTAYIEAQKCIMITPTSELATIPALKKQISRIQKVDAVPVILNLPAVSYYRRKSLIEHRIPFVTSKQIYLPFMGAYLTDEKEEIPKVKKFMFSTQQLFLFYLYHNKARIYMSESVEELPFSAMTMSRATKQIEAVRLLLVKKEGVKIVLESQCSRWELYKNAEKYLSSPVRRYGYIEKSAVNSNMVIAGETVLSEKTMLNPDRLITYAVYEKEFDGSLLIKELVDPEKQVRLELWAYDPKQFAQNGMADAASVALSFENSTDERIEEAVEEMLRKEWER